MAAVATLGVSAVGGEGGHGAAALPALAQLPRAFIIYKINKCSGNFFLLRNLLSMYG